MPDRSGRRKGILQHVCIGDTRKHGIVSTRALETLESMGVYRTENRLLAGKRPNDVGSLSMLREFFSKISGSNTEHTVGTQIIADPETCLQEFASEHLLILIFGQDRFCQE